MMTKTTTLSWSDYGELCELIPQRQLLDTGFKNTKSSFLAHPSPCSIFLEGSKQSKSWFDHLNTVNNNGRDTFQKLLARSLPKFLKTSITYGTKLRTIHHWAKVVRMLLTPWHSDPNLEFSQLQPHSKIGGIECLPPWTGWVQRLPQKMSTTYTC